MNRFERSPRETTDEGPVRVRDEPAAPEQTDAGFGRGQDSKPDAIEEGQQPDFARGQAPEGRPDAPRGDFAQGQDDAGDTSAERKEGNFATGQ